MSGTTTQYPSFRMRRAMGMYNFLLHEINDGKNEVGTIIKTIAFWLTTPISGGYISRQLWEKGNEYSTVSYSGDFFCVLYKEHQYQNDLMDRTPNQINSHTILATLRHRNGENGTKGIYLERLGGPIIA